MSPPRGARQEAGQQPGDAEPEDEGGEPEPDERERVPADLRAHGVHGLRHADGPGPAALVEDGDGGEEQLLVQRLAVARALRDAAAQRLGDLGAAAVGAGRDARGSRVAEQAPARVNDDHAAAHRACGRAGELGQLVAPVEPPCGAGRDELRLVGGLGLDLGIDPLGQVERQGDLERDEHEHEHVGERRELEDADAHVSWAAKRNPTPRTVWM